jgi:5'-nucleotidase
VRILVTNDDGIHAEGLQTLERVARVLSDDVWVVAPELEQSGSSRSLTLLDPIRVRTLDGRHFAVTGTPTDCVALGVQELVEGSRPDLVLSGVNRGHNLAEDVTLSGTVAGAIEGMALGIPAIALSQSIAFSEGAQPRYETAEAYGPGIIRRLLETGWPDGVVMNVNFPPVPPEEVRAVEVTRQGSRDVMLRFFEKRRDLRGRTYYWMGYRNRPSTPQDGTDLAAVFSGRISVTPLHIDLTHMPTVHDLKAVLGGAPPKATRADGT